MREYPACARGHHGGRSYRSFMTRPFVSQSISSTQYFFG
jgi:hypothetical protein